MTNIFYVYQHVDPRTNLVRYIGKGRGKRAWDLRDRHGHHKNWLKQLKNEGLEPRVELIETNKTEEQAFELERLWIAACRSSFQPLTNSTDGGQGASGCVKSEETRRKLSEALKGEKNPQFGRTGENSPNFGKTFNEEHRKKLSENHARHWLGKTHSEDTRKKLSKALKGKPAPNRRTVIGTNLATGEQRTFGSTYAAAAFVGGGQPSISDCCLGKQKTCKGWTFRYLESNTNKGETICNS